MSDFDLYIYGGDNTGVGMWVQKKKDKTFRGTIFSHISLNGATSRDKILNIHAVF